MGLLGNLIAGGLFVALLASEDDKVPIPKSDWNDVVGERIGSAAKRHLSSYNTALSNCRNALSDVKREAESKALEVKFDSKRNNLEWQAKQINEVNIEYLVKEATQILKG